MSARYAIYFAPDRPSAWRNFGAHWLGRDEHDNTALPQPVLANISAPELDLITQEPRRYGFHATLKAPFRLADGYTETSLVARLSALARQHKPVALGALRIAKLGDFVGLVPETACVNLQKIAASCVHDLDDLRAPLTATDLARRNANPLDARESELLALYGYPYVMERFRLHLTLTGRIDETTAQRVMHALTPKIAALNAIAPLSLDRLCMFVERTPGTPFHRIIDLKLNA